MKNKKTNKKKEVMSEKHKKFILKSIRYNIRRFLTIKRY